MYATEADSISLSFLLDFGGTVLGKVRQQCCQDLIFLLNVPVKASFCSTPGQHESSASPVSLLSLLVPKKLQKVNNYRVLSAKDGWRSAAK